MLTADTSGIVDSDGLSAFSYQWQRASSTTFSNIPGATQRQYTLGDDDAGQFVRYVVSFTDGRGTSEMVISSVSSRITNVNDVPTGIVTLTGDAKEESTLALDLSGIADADGLGTFSYQWQQALSPTAIFSDIPGADHSTYTLKDDDVGRVVRVLVSFTDGQATDESVFSPASSSIVNVNDAPTGGVTIDGATTEDSTLTANISTLADADGLGVISYQWQRAASIGGLFEDIVAAPTVQYTLGDADVGFVLRVIATYTDLHTTAESVTSDSTANITNVNDIPIGKVLIEGGAVEGRTLQAINAFVDADGIGNVSYQWQRASQHDLILSLIHI